MPVRSMARRRRQGGTSGNYLQRLLLQSEVCHSFYWQDASS